MSETTSFGEVRKATITALVDNRADLIVSSTDRVKYYTEKPLLAEHGFSALVDLDDGALTVLWDAGMTPIALPENMRRLGIDPTAIDKIALSHGHGDHYGAMAEVIQAAVVWPEGKRWEADATVEEMRAYARARRVSLIAHPAAFRERWRFRQDGTRWGPILPPPRGAWEAAGAEVTLQKGPYQLGPGCWTTGEVPRRSFERSGIPEGFYYRDGDLFIQDLIEEDQAIVINVRGKGLVILSGCAHSGIVNTIRWAQEISGVERLWAVCGGFHLARSTDEEIQRTIDEVKRLEPALVAPSHCTGFKAIQEFARQMPEAFVLGVVGATYLF